MQPFTIARIAAQPTRRPHLQRDAVAGTGDDAEQAELAFAAADESPQDGAARVLTAAFLHRQA